jgi:hypothetical protein
MMRGFNDEVFEKVRPIAADGNGVSYDRSMRLANVSNKVRR